MFEKSLKVLSLLIEGLIVLAATAIVGIVTVEVVLRKVFASSLIVTEELVRYMMVWVVFLASALAVRDRSHIRISFFVKKFGDRVQIWTAFAAHLLTAAFLVMLAVEGFRILPRQLHQWCITFDLTMFYFYLAIPVGSILMILYMLPRFPDVLAGKMVERDETVAERRGNQC